MSNDPKGTPALGVIFYGLLIRNRGFLRRPYARAPILHGQRSKAMLGFVKISPKLEPLAPQLAVREAIAFAVMMAILTLGLGVRLWIYLPLGLLQ
jgi:hypothetical protein